MPGRIAYWAEINAIDGYPGHAENIGGIVFTRKKLRKNRKEVRKKSQGVYKLGSEKRVPPSPIENESAENKSID